MQFQILCFFVLFLTSSTSAYKFEFIHFVCGSSDITYYGDAACVYGPEGLSTRGAISLTKEETLDSHGRALFTDPLTFKPNSTNLYSFKTSFTFSITPKTNHNPGHGLAFIVVPTSQNDAVSGLGYLSLVNRTSNGNPQNHLFAVEFDVFQDKSLKDINDNHVGIDINSVDSVVSVKSGYWVMTRNGWLFKDLKLSSGDRYQAWIEYNNNSKVISVTIGFENLKKPNRPLIEAKLDLSSVFLERMYTGFAGSMGSGDERHMIWDWSFENTAESIEIGFGSDWFMSHVYGKPSPCMF